MADAHAHTHKKALVIPKRIYMVAVDGSDDATRALERAVELAVSDRHDEIIIVTAVPPRQRLFSKEAALAKSDEDRKSAEQLLELMRKHAEEFTKCKLRTEVVEGDPRSAIVGAVKAFAVDYVFMGARGPTPLLGTAHVGSVSNYVVAYAGVPVMVVRDFWK